MKALRFLVPVALAGLVVIVALTRLSGSSDAEAFRLERESLRRELVERSAVTRGLAGPAGVDEARAVLRWWMEASAALAARHPRQAHASDPARPAKVSAKEKGSGKPKGPAKEADPAEAWRAYAAERLEVLRAGYQPLLWGSDSGIRLDVLAVRPGENPETHEQGLRVDFALWGAPRRLEREEGAGGPGRGALRVNVPVTFRNLAFRFFDPGGKLYGEMSGSGEPYLALKDPERFSSELPPGIVLGTWWVERFPREATRVELSVAVQVQGMTTASLAPLFRWDVPVAEAWKLGANEPFRAETREAPAAAPLPAGPAR